MGLPRLLLFVFFSLRGRFVPPLRGGLWEAALAGGTATVARFDAVAADAVLDVGEDDGWDMDGAEGGAGRSSTPSAGGEEAGVREA